MHEENRPSPRNWVTLVALTAVAGVLIAGWWSLFGPNGWTRSGVRPLQERIATFRDLPWRSQRLIAAIKRFHADKGRPPNELQELVPEYLPAIPDTGVARFPSFEYRSFPEGGLDPVVWYDLGSAEKEGTLGQTKYDKFGPPEHAIMVVQFHWKDNDYVLCAKADRLNVNGGEQAFDPWLWRTDKLTRARAVPRFLREVYPQIKTKHDLIELLGEPDGAGVLWETPWELSVTCNWGLWTSDRVIYWPTKKYKNDPRLHFPIEDWLYERDNF